jgi:hypothetical protein
MNVMIKQTTTKNKMSIAQRFMTMNTVTQADSATHNHRTVILLIEGRIHTLVITFLPEPIPSKPTNPFCIINQGRTSQPLRDHYY